jgi:hypothetical protein
MQPPTPVPPAWNGVHVCPLGHSALEVHMTMPTQTGGLHVVPVNPTAKVWQVMPEIVAAGTRAAPSAQQTCPEQSDTGSWHFQAMSPVAHIFPMGWHEDGTLELSQHCSVPAAQSWFLPPSCPENGQKMSSGPASGWGGNRLPGALHMLQLPLLHTVPVPQTVPQAPQFAASSRRLAQPLLHGVCSNGHAWRPLHAAKLLSQLNVVPAHLKHSVLVGVVAHCDAQLLAIQPNRAS